MWSGECCVSGSYAKDGLHELSLPVLPEYTLHAESYTLILLSFSAKAEGTRWRTSASRQYDILAFWHLSTLGFGGDASGRGAATW